MRHLMKDYSNDELVSLITAAKEELVFRSLFPAENLTLCAECGLPQASTPSGLVCANGHGGAESVLTETEQPVAEELTADQDVAWQKIKAWLLRDDPVFLLKGFAGTGKSFLMKKLLELPHSFIFSAPTNKASAVLADFIGLPTKTTYSVLGLRMTAEEDQLVLTQVDELPNLGNNPILVIDEAGMVPKFMVRLLRQACAERGWRIIYVGDPAQHTPVGESRSPCWSETKDPACRALLREVRRFDNQLLRLSMGLRQSVIDPTVKINIEDDNKDGEGVFVMNEREWSMEVKQLQLADWRKIKIAAWRNRTCDKHNRMVRKALGFTNPFEIGELVLLAAPLFQDGDIVAHTDEEVEIRGITERTFNFPEGTMDAWVFTTNRSFVLNVPKHDSDLANLLNLRAGVASKKRGREAKEYWSKFWEVKHMFVPVRYGYALTSHRLQGTTLEGVYADMQDVMANNEKRARARTAYVIGTRAQKFLKTF